MKQRKRKVGKRTRRGKKNGLMSFLKRLFGKVKKVCRELKYAFPKKDTVDYNAKKMRKEYPLNEYGYFGTAGDNKRIISSKNHIKESKEFYSKASSGGKAMAMDNGKGTKTIMRDGGVVTYRENTKTKNSPAVDFGKMTGKVKNQRVHFIEKGDEK